MGVEGHAGGHDEVVQGVRHLLGVQDHQAHHPQLPGDPGTFQAVHRGEPQHHGASATLAGVPLPLHHN